MFNEAPADTPIPEVVRTAGPARRLRDAFEPLAMHQVWSPSVQRRVDRGGLDFFRGYVWGRAAVLGDVEPAVAASAFAVFEPGVIGAGVQAGRAAIDRPSLLALLDRTTIASLTEVLMTEPVPQADVDPGGHGHGHEQVAAALRGAVEQADGTGRPLFSGVRALGWPDEPVGQLWRACHALREHRGDSHTAAFVAAGLDPVRMNILTELWLGYGLGDYSSSRAWSAAATAIALDHLRAAGLLDGDRLTDTGRAPATRSSTPPTSPNSPSSPPSVTSSMASSSRCRPGASNASLPACSPPISASAPAADRRWPRPRTRRWRPRPVSRGDDGD